MALRGRWAMRFATLIAAVALSGCAALTPPPEPTSLPTRLAAFPTSGLPLQAPVTVRWNAYKIPFIEAQTDQDAAFAFGMVQAHLRLGQMAVIRRIVQGRLSESFGPFTTDLDVALRAFDFYRATDRVYAAMPTKSRAWLDAYVAGVNAYAERLAPHAFPHEFTVLDIDWEPWTAADSITIGRASGIDVNWFTTLQLLSSEDPKLRDRALKRIARLAGSSATTIKEGDRRASSSDRLGLEQIAGLAPLIGKSGSNSFVVAPGRSATGAAIIANDPHLGFIIPNIWVIAGLRSPSYSMVGMAVPGTPVFGFGRNETLAWGGTNLRARISQLVDVSALPDAAFEIERQKISVRAWLNKSATTRRTRYGPVLSELDASPTAGRSAPFAVRWVGHTVSDEITALLGAMRARTVSEFKEAMTDFAVPPQTFLAADVDGSIAAVIAAKVPARPARDPLRLLATPERSDRDWSSFYRSDDFPFARDPASGFLASSNNRPTADETRPFGGFFPVDERVRRLKALVSRTPEMTVERAMAIQMDTVSPLSRRLVAAMTPRLRAWRPRTADEAAAIKALLSWNGDYAVDSVGALVFEAFLTRFGPAAYAALGREDEFELYKGVSRLRRFLIDDLEDLEDDDWARALDPALKRAAEIIDSDERWGDVHRLDVQHVFGALPLIGGPYKIKNIAMPGSRETILKSSHTLTDQRHSADFGAQSRHVSDLSDLDENYFVLLGGQDGWIGSENFADQTRLWRAGQAVRTPLSRDGVRRSFPRVVTLRPN